MQNPSGPRGHGRALLAPPPSPWTPPGSPSAGFRISKAEFYSSAPHKHAPRAAALPYRGSPGESGGRSPPQPGSRGPCTAPRHPPAAPGLLHTSSGLPLLPSHLLLLLLFLPRGLCPASVPGSGEVAAVQAASAMPKTQKSKMFFPKKTKNVAEAEPRPCPMPLASAARGADSGEEAGGGWTAASPSLPSDVFAKNPGYKEI